MSEPKTLPLSPVSAADGQEVHDPAGEPPERCLDSLHKSLWAHLTQAVGDRRHPFHTPTLVTLTPEGLPDARTVVLRRACPRTRLLAFHTDRRSPKWEQLRREPRVLWHCYSAPHKLQLRLRAVAELHYGDAAAREAWASAALSSRRTYCTRDAPGTPLEEAGSGLPPEFENRVPTLPESERGWEQFVLVTTTVTHIDLLSLAARGHRRAQWEWQEPLDSLAPPLGRWVAP